jgi:hypothetical protein
MNNVPLASALRGALQLTNRLTVLTSAVAFDSASLITDLKARPAGLVQHLAGRFQHRHAEH